MRPNQPINAADLRAIVARNGEPIYVVAGRARIHPVTLSRLLRGHEPIKSDVVSRVLLALRQKEAVNA